MENQSKYKGIKVMIISCLLTLLSFSLIQAQEPPAMPEMGKEDMARMHMEGMMMNEVNMLMDLYDQDVMLYNFPDSKIAVGSDESKKYWEKKFQNEGEQAIEPLQTIQVGETVFLQYREINHQTMIPLQKAVIFVFKESKIISMYFISE